MNILQSPSLTQVQVIADWLRQDAYQNSDLEFALNLVLTGRIGLQNSGEWLAIAHTSPTPEPLDPHHIRGVIMARPGNTNVSIAASDRPTAETLLTLALAKGCPRRLAASAASWEWIRPLLMPHYGLQRVHHSLILQCTTAPPDGAGRWAGLEDKPVLQAYAVAYRAERGAGNVNQNWEDLIQRQQVAVLEHHSGDIAAVVKRNSTASSGLVLGIFTFPAFRQQGFAKRLLAFLIAEILQDYPTVKLWVDDDNTGAIALYHSLGFEEIGSFYTAYFHERSIYPN